MPINFIPNDPLAQHALPMRRKTARRDRPAGRAGFTYVGAVPQRRYDQGTPGFLFWQCREAALWALATWEALDGKVTLWARSAPDRTRLALVQNEAVDLNAYYDGQSLSFFEHTTRGKTTFTGASTDVVAHEAGHALLDVIRPDLWDSTLTEPNAFHEAFADCLALLVALSDDATRRTLLQTSQDLGTVNFVEATAEDLADGVRRAFGPSDPSAAPRHALNTFKWQLPTTLPRRGPPQTLTSEVHSFGRIFSGCFYDTLRNIFLASPTRGEAALRRAATTAGSLLIAAARGAPETARFFQSVGRAMVLADEAANRAANREAIRQAFEAHHVALGSSAMLAPTRSLAGAAPKHTARGARLPQATRRDLLRRIEAAPGDRLAVAPVEIAGSRVTCAVHYREVPLTGISERLRDVVAIAAEPVLVGAAGPRAAVLGGLPDASTTIDEVYAFVESLLRNDGIVLDGGRRSARRAAVEGASPEPSPPAAQAKAIPPTHTVRTRGGRKVLTRLRFV